MANQHSPLQDENDQEQQQYEDYDEGEQQSPEQYPGQISNALAG